MPERFRHAVIVGKYQARGIRPMLEELAHFLVGLGLEVSFERELGVVVGGDGTMLGIAREVARQHLPLVGINQGRLGFITDIPHGQYRDALTQMIAGDYEEEHLSLIHI